MSFLGLEGKKVLVFGIANRKSVAFHIAKLLETEGVKLFLSVQTENHAEFARKSFPDAKVYICDVSDEESMRKTAENVCYDSEGKIYGIAHSIAFANFAEGLKPFHKTSKKDFLQAIDISCYSFISIANLYKDIIESDGAMVTISISTTRMAAENYGFMAPVKAALDSSVVFLAKSLSEDTRIRVNAVGASLLKTSSSAGIPNYLEPYLFAECATLRKKALETSEVANVAVFLLSPSSSGINAQTVIVDAGMSCNYFDKKIISAVVKTL